MRLAASLPVDLCGVEPFSAVSHVAASATGALQRLPEKQVDTF